ncbi:MAG: Wzz/FepE/Etk N-terminal domain-containing protein [Oscillospiraceae bacterium]
MDYYSPKNEYYSSEIDESLDLKSLKPIISFFTKNVIWILLSCIICGVGAFAIAKYAIPKQYVSAVKIYASVDNPEHDKDIASANSELTYTKGVIETYTNILNSADYYKTVSAYLGNKASAGEIAKSVTFSPINNTNLFKVIVKTRSSEASYYIADAVSKTAFETIKSIDTQAVLRTVDSPAMANSPSSPNIMLYTLLGIILGGLVGTSICFIYAAFDIKIRSSNDIQAKYDIPILAEIPNFK